MESTFVSFIIFFALKPFSLPILLGFQMHFHPRKHIISLMVLLLNTIMVILHKLNSKSESFVMQKTDTKIAFDMSLRSLNFPNKKAVFIEFPLVFIYFVFSSLLDEIDDVFRI